MKRLILVSLALNVSLHAQTPAPAPENRLPADLAEVVFGAKKQEHRDYTILGAAMRGIPALDGRPLLLWSRDGALEIADERAAAAEWLGRAREALGFGTFDIAYVGRGKFRTLDYHEFALRLDGRRFLDTHVEMYFANGRFVGLYHNFPAPLLSIDAAELAGDGELVWFAQREDARGYRIVPARVVVRDEAQRRVHEVRTARGLAYTWIEAGSTPTPAAAATFREYRLPTGTFPDQIWAASNGLIWLSQPSNGLVTSFDPQTQKWAQFPIGGSAPDGLWVDDQDRVWTGIYNSGQLGLLDAVTKKVTRINMPYGSSRPAIPSPSSHGTIWVTDHIQNRISEYDPQSAKWLGSHVLPIASSWVVEGCVDPGGETSYFTGYRSHTLPYKPYGKPIGNIPVPSRTGPSFPAFRDGKVWFTNWNSGRLGVYDIATKQVTEYLYRSTERGGPISTLPTGEVIVGTRSLGYIVVFDPQKATFREFKIPTATGLKDGLTVAPDGTIWFTGSGANKIAQLVLK